MIYHVFPFHEVLHIFMQRKSICIVWVIFEINHLSLQYARFVLDDAFERLVTGMPKSRNSFSLRSNNISIHMHLFLS